MYNQILLKNTETVFSIVAKKKEVCYIKKNGGGRIRINYEGVDDLINKINSVEIQPTTQGVYFCPNPTTNTTSASKAEDITAREWLIIDIDNAYRAKNESINPDVHAEFKQKYLPLIEEVIDFNSLCCKLWNSGNGYHITLKCELGVDEATEKAVKEFYSTLSKIELGGGWQIDTSMAKRSQLTKFYGTWTHKGEARLSSMCNEYALYKGEIINFNNLIKLTENMENKIKIQKNRQFVEELLENYQPNNNLAWSENYVKLEKCPMTDQHTTTWSCTIYFDGQEPRFHCFGEHCQNDKGEQLHTFADFYKQLTGAEWKTTTTTTITPKKTKGITLAEIETEGEFVGYATGIKALDDALGGGLRKKTYSVLTGNPGEGKSTLCVQIINNLLSQGYKVGYYQSDLSLPMTKANLILQSGMSEKQYTEKYQDKLALFGVNEFGYENISTCGEFDVFFIDNMASLLPSKSDYDFQKQLAKQVKATAEKSENHIVWVCHQRKHNDFDSIDKIEGTSDISRFAYTVVDVVKCNKDYWNKVKNTHGRVCDEILEFAKSVEEGTPILAKINLFKNQQTGQSDSISMCFSQENKTFTPYEVAA